MRTRYREEEKAELVNKYRQSGKSTAAFAAAEGLKAPTFYNWLKKAGCGKEKSSRFVELKVPSCREEQGKITVRKNGIEVMVYNIESFEKVIEVMAAL